MAETTEQSTDPGTPGVAPPLSGGLLLAVQTPGSRAMRFASLLGCVEPDYMLLRSSPAHPGDLKAMRLQLGDVLMVRYVEAGTAYGFRVHVTRVLQQPELLVFTSLPAIAEARSLRSEKRIPCMIPCLVAGSGLDGARGLLLDLSSCGCQLALHREVPAPELDAALNLSLAVPGVELQLEGWVRRIQHREAGHRLGLQFAPEADAPRQALEAVEAFSGLLQ